jgi:hypothetical protein
MIGRMLLAALLGVAAASAGAQATEEGGKFDPLTMRAASVPLAADPLDLAQKSDPIWVKGGRPKADRIAALTLRPLETVVTEAPLGSGYGDATILVMAVAGDTQGYGTRAEAAAIAAKIDCGAGAGAQASRIVCVADTDKDGRFDAYAPGAGEAGNVPEQLSLIAKMEPLPAPVRYRAAHAEERPAYRAVYTNCAKDHDRPRYALVVEGQGAWATIEQLLANQGNVDAATRNQYRAVMAIQGYGTPCEAAEPLAPGERLYPAASVKGSVPARMGELAILVGPKDAGAPVTLLGLLQPDRLYRISGRRLLPFAGQVTATQTALAVQQKFPDPVFATTDAARAFEGDRRVGEVLLQGAFSHGYMGVLTADTTISGLFSSRSLPRGTTLYGIPMSSRLFVTQNGVAMSPLTPPPISSPDQVRLTWCVPVEEKGKWTATCLPTQPDRYTLLAGQAPAFEVTGLSYASGTVTNVGPVPVEQGKRSFERPLTHRFVLKELRHSTAFIAQDTLYGDALVSSRVHEVALERGGGGIAYGGGRLALSRGSVAGTLSVKVVEPFKAGAEARGQALFSPQKPAEAGSAAPMP